MGLIGGQLLVDRLILVADAHRHHLIKGAVGVVLGLIAGGGDIGHIVGHHVQPPPLRQHPGGQVVEPSHHSAKLLSSSGPLGAGHILVHI